MVWGYRCKVVAVQVDDRPLESSAEESEQSIPSSTASSISKGYASYSGGQCFWQCRSHLRGTAYDQWVVSVEEEFKLSS